MAATDLAESYRGALDGRLEHAIRVADPFHVVRVGHRRLDRVRRHLPAGSVIAVPASGMVVHRLVRGLPIAEADFVPLSPDRARLRQVPRRLVVRRILGACRTS